MVKILYIVDFKAILFIHQNGEYLLSFINGILDISKIESQLLALKSANFNLREFLLTLVKLFHHNAHEKNISRCILLK